MIDIDATLNADVLDAFAKIEGILYHPHEADDFTVRGEVRRDQVEVGGEGEAVSVVRQHTLSLRQSECPVGFAVIIDADEIDIDGVRWRVVDQDDNGEGFITLFLHKVT